MAQEVKSFSFSISRSGGSSLFPHKCGLSSSVRSGPPSGRFPRKPAQPFNVPMTQQALTKCKKFSSALSLIHRKVASSQLLRLPSPDAKTQTLQVSPPAEMVFLRGRRTEGGGVVGRQEAAAAVAARLPQKIPLAIFNPFCFMRGSVELATVLARIGRARPRFFSTKS